MGGVSRHLLGLVGSNGSLTGLDMDAESIALARNEFCDKKNINFRVLNVEEDILEFNQTYDFIYCRFLLEHLSNPAQCIKQLYESLKPGGLFIAQTIDCEGQFCWPENTAYTKAADILGRLIDVRGGQSGFGRRLPSVLHSIGFSHIDIKVENLVYLEGEGKQFVSLTLEAMRKGVLEEKLLDKDDFWQLLNDLREFCSAPDSIVSLPRFVHCAGRKPC